MVEAVGITIRGAAGERVRAEFEEFEINIARTDTRTRLRASLPDQAALHGGWSECEFSDWRSSKCVSLTRPTHDQGIA